MALTLDQALALGVQALNTLQQPSRTSELAAVCFQPQLRAHCANHAIDLSDYASETDLAAIIGRSFSAHISREPEARRFVEKRPDRRWALGPASPTLLQATTNDLQRPGDSQFTGLSGEYAVISELLACNWNAAKFPHDDGVDVVATQAGKLRTVQVKTAHGSDRQHATFSFTVKKSSHERHNGVQHYYVLVLRRIMGPRWLNDFVILNTHDMNDLISHGCIGSAGDDALRIAVQITEGSYLIGTRDISNKVNRFRTLFV